MAYSYDGYLRFNTEVDQSGFNNGVNSMKSAAELGAKAIGIGITAATTAVTALSTAAIVAGSNFEAGMSKVQATSRASAADMDLLSAKAKEMGATTKFSATESAQALNYMAMAGWKTQSMLEGLPGIMNLAAASGEDLASVSDIVTDAMTAFGMRASESGHFADVLATAASNANTNVGMMGSTFKYVAPIAGSLGYSVEDTAVAIGLMANAGIKAEQAGTQLRALLTRLVSPTKDSAAAMDALKLSATNTDGTLKSFATILQDLRSGMQGYTDDQKASYAAMLGGQEAMSGLLAIVNASETDFQNLTQAINNSGGAAEDMAKTVNDNLKGDLTILGSTAESVGIKVYEKFQIPMRNAAQTATDSLGKILSSLNSGQLDKSVDKIADAASNLLVATAKLAADGLPKLINGFAYIADHGKQVTSITVGITTAFIGYKAAVSAAAIASEIAAAATEALATAQIAETAATGLGTKAWILFNAAIAANPIGLAAVVLGALAAGLVYYNQVQDESTEKTNKLIDATKDKISAWKESKKAKLEEMQTQVSELETTKEMIDELGRLTDANGKVGDNKERVAYLSEKINEIIPDTVKFIDDETVAIDGNIESLKRQIELKQANILLDELEADAVQARKERTESIGRQLEIENNIAAQEGEIEKLRSELAEAGSTQRMSWIQKEIHEKENQLNKTKASLNAEKGYYEERNKVIDDSSKLAIAIQQEDFAEVSRIMTQRELKLKAAGDSTKAELEKQVGEMQAEYDYLTQTYGNSTSQAIQAQITETKRLLDEYKAELDRRTPDLEKAMLSNGENVTLGFAKGLITPYALTQIQGSANILADTADRSARARLRIQSPSRVAMITGEFYAEGFAVGITKNKDTVIDAVRTMSDESIKVAKEKATGYKEIGTLYISYMKESINSRKNSMIEQVQKLIDDNVEKQIESLDKANEKLTKKSDASLRKANDKAKTKYREAATELMNTYKKALETGADEANTLMSKKIQGITEEAQTQYDEIIRQRDRMQNKLSDFGDLFTRDEDGKIQLENINDQTDALKRYQTALEELQDKGISGGLLQEILDLGVEDGTDLAEKLLKNDGVFQQYNEAWTLKQEAAKTIAEQFYADELTTLDEDFSQKLDTALASIPTECTNVGIDAIQGTIDGMNSKKGDAVQTAKDIADAIITELKRATETASPSKRAAREVGKPITQGVIKGMNDAYDPQELQAYTDKMMVDIGVSQSKAATQSVSYMSNTNSVSNSTVYNEAPMQNFFNLIDGTTDNVKQAMKEYEFYRRQRAWATGGV